MMVFVVKRDMLLLTNVLKECFSHPDIELFREHTLEHMGALWTAWRSSLNARYVKNCKNKTEILKNVPDGMSAKDWEWLVTNKFLTDEYKGLENETSLDVAQLFFETRQKNGKLEADAQKKYDEIVEIVKSNPSLSHIEVLEQSFGPQLHSHVFCYGGGVKRKDFSDPRVAYIKELEAKLHEKDEELCEKDEENHKIRGRIDKIESRLTQIEDTQLNPNSLPTSNIDVDLEQYYSIFVYYVTRIEELNASIAVTGTT
ncbi:hypothetical protein C2S52_012196 [Perilla frutescens var. hirtella]|nr:hypothetical protein C2S52_012196 [Perilla frutescens var. hirtella]